MCSRSLEISGHNNFDFVNNTSPHPLDTMLPPQTRTHATVCYHCQVCSLSTHSMGESTHTPDIYSQYSNTSTHSSPSNIIVVSIEPPTYTSSPDTTLYTTVIPPHTSIYVSEYEKIVVIQDAQNPLQNFFHVHGGHAYTDCAITNRIDCSATTTPTIADCASYVITDPAVATSTALTERESSWSSSVTLIAYTLTLSRGELTHTTVTYLEHIASMHRLATSSPNTLLYTRQCTHDNLRPEKA